MAILPTTAGGRLLFDDPAAFGAQIVHNLILRLQLAGRS
jgi:hypothetical protein